MAIKNKESRIRYSRIYIYIYIYGYVRPEDNSVSKQEELTMRGFTNPHCRRPTPGINIYNCYWDLLRSFESQLLDLVSQLIHLC